MQKDDVIIQAKHETIRKITKQANYDLAKLEHDNAEFVKTIEKEYGLKFQYATPIKAESALN